MQGRFLCWIGSHDMVTYTITESEYSKLIGHRCKRCLTVAEGQEGLAELARFYAQRRPFVVDKSWPPFTIVADQNNETEH